MGKHVGRKNTWFYIVLFSLVVQSCGGGGGSPDTGGPVGSTGSDLKTELTDTMQLTTDNYIASASNDAGQVLALVAHEDSSGSGTTEIRALQYTPSGGWEKPITVVSGATVKTAGDLGVNALVISNSGDAVFAWEYDPPLSGVGYELWTVARIGGVWQAPNMLTSKAGLATYSLVKDPSNQSVAGGLWKTVDHELYFSRYRSASGWDTPQLVTMVLGGETSISILDAKLGMDNAGNQYVAVTGNPGLRVRKRTITGWEDPQQIYTYDNGNGEYSPFVLHFAVAPSGKAMIAYPKKAAAADNFAPYYRTFNFNGTLWSGRIDTPIGVSADTLIVDNSGSAALGSDIYGVCFKPGTGWDAVAVFDIPTNAGSSWTPCLDTGGVLTRDDVLISADKSTTYGNWAAKIGTAGWSQEHLLTAGLMEPIKAIHFGKGVAVVLYEKYGQIPVSLWAGRWATPSDW